LWRVECHLIEMVQSGNRTKTSDSPQEPFWQERWFNNFGTKCVWFCVCLWAWDGTMSPAKCCKHVIHLFNQGCMLLTVQHVGSKVWLPVGVREGEGFVDQRYKLWTRCYKVIIKQPHCLPWCTCQVRLCFQLHLPCKFTSLSWIWATRQKVSPTHGPFYSASRPKKRKITGLWDQRPACVSTEFPHFKIFKLQWT
jgi:hypothetical protein